MSIAENRFGFQPWRAFSVAERKAYPVQRFRKPMIQKKLVALTGIERVKFQSSSVQLGLSRCIWVQLVR